MPAAGIKRTAPACARPAPPKRRTPCHRRQQAIGQPQRGVERPRHHRGRGGDKAGCTRRPARKAVVDVRVMGQDEPGRYPAAAQVMSLSDQPGRGGACLMVTNHGLALTGTHPWRCPSCRRPPAWSARHRLGPRRRSPLPARTRRQGDGAAHSRCSGRTYGESPAPSSCGATAPRSAQLTAWMRMTGCRHASSFTLKCHGESLASRLKTPLTGHRYLHQTRLLAAVAPPHHHRRRGGSASRDRQHRQRILVHADQLAVDRGQGKSDEGPAAPAHPAPGMARPLPRSLAHSVSMPSGQNRPHHARPKGAWTPARRATRCPRRRTARPPSGC